MCHPRRNDDRIETPESTREEATEREPTGERTPTVERDGILARTKAGLVSLFAPGERTHRQPDPTTRTEKPADAGEVNDGQDDQRDDAEEPIPAE